MRFANKALLVLVAATALSGHAPVQWEIREAPPELRTTIAQADRMIAAMQDSLVHELTQALSQVAPEQAINSCHVESELMSQRFTREGATV